MAFDHNNVHVLGLTPRDQYLLRLVLTNLCAAYLDKTVREAAGEQMEIADRKAVQAVNFFTRFCGFIDMLCPEAMLGRARSKVLMIQPTMMKYLVIAFNGYDPKDNYLSPEQRQHLDPSFDTLKKKVVESYQYVYNRYEIETAKK